MFTESNIEEIKSIIREKADETPSDHMEFGAGSVKWNKAQAKFVLKIESYRRDLYNGAVTVLARKVKNTLREWNDKAPRGAVHGDPPDKIRLSGWRSTSKQIRITFDSEVNGKTLEQLNINRLAERYDIAKYCDQILAIQDYSPSGKVRIRKYKIIGIRPKNHKYPIIIEDINRGRRLKTNPSFIKTSKIVSPI